MPARLQAIESLSNANRTWPGQTAGPDQHHLWGAMWVYSYRLLPARLKLDIGSGAWLDYWLFLHADETPAVFAARPISLHSLLEALDLARATAQWSLMEAVTTELRG